MAPLKLGENGLYPTSFTNPKARQIKPTIHKEGSKLWNAFHDSAVVQGNDPGRLIRTLVEEKGWDHGKILEVGAGVDPVITRIEGFEHFIVTLDSQEADICRQRAPFATVFAADAADLPFGPLEAESCDVIVWQGAMLHYVKLFAGELDLPLFYYEEINGRDHVETYRFLRAISEAMKRGGILIELYPFLDILEVPLLLAYLELPMRDIQFIERKPDFLSESENYYLMLRSMDMSDIAARLRGEPTTSPEEELAHSPFSAMVVEK